MTPDEFNRTQALPLAVRRARALIDAVERVRELERIAHETGALRRAAGLAVLPRYVRGRIVCGA